MRLFIAINFDDDTKLKILDVQNRLKQYSHGSFSSPENMHLTLVFLGEVSPQKLNTIEKTIKHIRMPKLHLTFNHMDYFRKHDGDIWWIGLEHNKQLLALQKKIHDSLLNAGFELEKRTYTPHITLARKVKSKIEIFKNSIMGEKFSADVNAFSLMLSERTEGRHKYTELFRKSH